MGYEKNRRIEEDDQGWRYSDKDICYRCISDSYLREMARSDASEFECSFCGWRTRKAPNSIPFNTFMEVYSGAVFQYYSHVDSEGMAWDQEDQRYVGTTYDTWDLVKDVIGEPSDNEQVVQEIIESLGHNIWCDKNPYGLTGAERYESSWEAFCKTVKHEIRYFFDAKEPDPYSDRIPIPDMLDELRDIIEQAGLVGTLPAGTQFFRIRAHNRMEVCDTWRSLGSPPPEAAPSNRMSAAGISVFYAAMDMATARAETIANFELADRRILTGATWTNGRPLNVLDLSRLPEAPSFFAQVRYDRDHLIFLKQFVETITQPVQHDGREHTEYVPSQVVTEYFRHRYGLPDKSKLDAIIYPSAQKKRGRSIVIFASPEDLAPPLFEGIDRVPIIMLSSKSIRSVRRGRR